MISLRFGVKLRAIERAVFRSDVEIVGITLWELHASDINILLQFFWRLIGELLNRLLGLSEHIHVPDAKLPIIRNWNNVMRVNWSYHIKRVNWIGVSRSKGSPLNWSCLRSQIPQHNLSVVQTSQYEILLVRVKLYARYLRLFHYI